LKRERKLLILIAFSAIKERVQLITGSPNIMLTEIFLNSSKKLGSKMITLTFHKM
jgi:hypothetical protein